MQFLSRMSDEEDLAYFEFFRYQANVGFEIL